MGPRPVGSDRQTVVMPSTPSAGVGRPLAKWSAIGLLALCEVLALALWFSVSAVIPAIRAEFDLTDFQVSLYASSVGVGFAFGTLGSAVLGLADRLEPRRFFMAAIMVAAAANAAILLFEPTAPVVVLLRLITGACMAGVYPVGMKMAATWAKRDTGLVIGVLIGALTLGTAVPHLFAAIGGLDWRLTLVLASLSAALSGVLVLLVPLGPALGPARPFDPAYVLRAWTDKALRLVNLGYFGHMWELYAMWGWIGVFLHASFTVSFAGAGADPAHYAKLTTFAVIGCGAFGCLFGGVFADRMGRTTLTIGAMGLSGLCCVLVGFLYGGNPWLLVVLCLVWGIAVVADSAQFSSSVIELSDPSVIGTMLTVQTCIGFLLTLVTVHLVPPLVQVVGWQYAFAVLAIGPFFGVWAMGRLRRHPDSVKLANGRR